MDKSFHRIKYCLELILSGCPTAVSRRMAGLNYRFQNIALLYRNLAFMHKRIQTFLKINLFSYD